MKEEEQLVIVGFVRGAHGIAGEFKVESASGYYEHFEKLVHKEVALRNASCEKRFEVESVKAGNETLFMKLAMIDTPEDVAKYRNWEIVVSRKYAHKPEKDEWYIEDLKGCSLVWNGERVAAGTAPTALKNENDSETVGTITDVLEGGSGYLLEVSISESCTCLKDELKFTSAGKTRSVLVPFTYKHVSNIDTENKTIQLMHLWILE